MKYNNELKAINTQEKAYLLGFLFGDGTITTYVEKTGRIRFLTKISISKDDEDLIWDLKKYFPFFNVGEFNYSKYNKNSNSQKSISKSSKELYNDLLFNGVYPRKSYENASKLKIPNIEILLIPHFIRGFFDADGTIYSIKNRKNLRGMEFSSVSKELIESIDNYLKSLKIYSSNIIAKQPIGKNGQVCYNLIFNRTNSIINLIAFMYNGSTISLKRKSDKCLSFTVVDKVLDRNMTCPNCQSRKVTKNGTRGNSRRYVCELCKKGFSQKIMTNNFNLK